MKLDLQNFHQINPAVWRLDISPGERLRLRGTWRGRDGVGACRLAAPAAGAGGISLACRPAAQGIDVTVRLRLAANTFVSFCGVELGPLALTASDKFLGETPGFLEKSGVTSALAAQAEKRVAALCGMVARPGKISCLAGIGALHDDPSAFQLVGGRLRAGCAPNRELAAGAHAFRFFIGFHADPLRLLLDYGAYLAPLGRVDRTPALTGWNSWDFYGGAVTMPDVMRELRAARTLRCRRKLNYCTVDMGWAEACGDWRPNRNFPGGLRRMAAAIKAAGWRPGIWSAPLQVGQFTTLARRRQDLFLRDERGALIIINNDAFGPVLLLDYSLPETAALVGGWFKSMRRAGFELFKVDYIYESFIAQAAHPGRHIGKAAFVRRIFQVIRDAIGADACLVNCGGRKEAALGLVDACRISVDIHNFWGHIRNNARQAACAFWMHRQLWQNDPDFAICRHPGNCSARFLNMPYTARPLLDANNFWMSGPEANAVELETWLSVVRLCAGPVFLADSIAELRPGGRRLLDRLFPMLDAPFLPLDLFDSQYPAVWLSRDPRRPTLGIFNWMDEPRDVALPAPVNGNLRGRDFWRGTPVRLAGTVRLAPHAVLLVNL